MYTSCSANSNVLMTKNSEKLSFIKVYIYHQLKLSQVLEATEMITIVISKVIIPPS